MRSVGVYQTKIALLLIVPLNKLYLQLYDFTFCLVDVDECKVKPKQCGSNGMCVNTAGSYFCLCKHGFAAKGSKCQGIT